MPRDQRLYMTFPNDFPWHPKVARLDPAVKWAFVEMNGYSRMGDLDGVIPVADAEFMWSREILDALVNSHPARPLVLRTDDNYVIRDYAEHQQTKAERDELAAKRSEAGRKGGLAKSQASASNSQANGGKPKQSQSPESRVQSDSSKTSLRQSRNESGPVVTDDVLSPTLKRLSLRHGITSVPAVWAAVLKHTNRNLSAEGAFDVALWILAKKSGEPPRAPQRYVTGAISRNPFEVQQYIDEGGTQ